MVVATNHIGDVEELCDRVCIIARGRIAGSREIATAARGEIAEFYRNAVESGS